MGLANHAFNTQHWMGPPMVRRKLRERQAATIYLYVPLVKFA